MTSSVQLLTLIPGQNLKAGIQGRNRLVQMVRSAPVEKWEIQTEAGPKMENVEPIWAGHRLPVAGPSDKPKIRGQIELVPSRTGGFYLPNCAT